MEESFTERFKTYSDEKLMDVLLHHEQYKQEAIEAAVFLLKKRNKLDDAQQLLLAKIENLEQVEEEKRIEAQEQVERLQPIDFGKYFSVYTGSLEQIEFERHLLEADIPFQTTEGIDFVYLRPVLKYYVPVEEYERAAYLHGLKRREEPQKDGVDQVKAEQPSIEWGTPIKWIIATLIVLAAMVVWAVKLGQPL